MHSFRQYIQCQLDTYKSLKAKRSFITRELKHIKNHYDQVHDCVLRGFNYYYGEPANKQVLHGIMDKMSYLITVREQLN